MTLDMSKVLWVNLPFGAVLRTSDGETVMMLGTREGVFLDAVSLVLPAQGIAEGWSVKPGDLVAPFVYNCEQWERVE